MEEMKEKKEKKRLAEEAMPELAPEEKVMRRLRGKQAKRAREEDGGDLREEKKKHEVMEPDSGDVGMKEAEEEEQGPPWVKVTPQAKTVAMPVVVPGSPDELMSEARDVKRPATSDELPRSQQQRRTEAELTDQVIRAAASDPRCVA